MNNLQFKQGKTAWRLVVLKADIRTIGRIFQLCRENNELSNEELLWEILCRRDFDREGNRRVYFTCFKYGSHYRSSRDLTAQNWVRGIEEDNWTKGIGFPRYVFSHNHVTFVTSRYWAPNARLLPFDTKHENEKATYQFSHSEGRMISHEDPCQHILFIAPLLRWILERFDIFSLSVGPNKLCFFGPVRSSHHLISNSEPYVDINESYCTYYKGDLRDLEDRLINIANEENIVEEMPIVKT